MVSTSTSIPTPVLPPPELGQMSPAERVYRLSPIELSTSADNILFGVMMVMAWTYFTTFKKDRLIIKSLVGSLVALNIVQTATTIAYNVEVILVYFSSFGYFNLFYVMTIQTVESLATGLAQVFFLHRVYNLSKSRFLAGFLLLLVLAGMSLGLASTVLTGVLPGSTNVDDTVFGSLHTLNHIMISWKATTLACDLILTSSIVCYLHRSRNGWRRTETIISSLIYFTCEAQLLPLMASFFFLVTYARDPSGTVFLVASFAEAKLASLSVLHLLNSRTRIRRDLAELPSPSLRFDLGREKGAAPPFSPPSVTHASDFAKGGPGGVVLRTREVSNPSSPDERSSSESGRSRTREGRVDSTPERRTRDQKSELDEDEGDEDEDEKMDLSLR